MFRLLKNNIIIITALCLWAFNSPQAQLRDLDAKTQQEIQAVQDYLNKYVEKSYQMYPKTESVKKEGTIDKYKEYEKYLQSAHKTAGHEHRKSYLMNANKIQSLVTNYGGIGGGYGAIRNINNLVWRGMPYVFQYGAIVGASVKNPYDTTQRFRIFSDGLWDYPAQRTVNPTGDTLWQWQPLPGYDDPDQPNMAHSPDIDADRDGKPDSWPRHWYNEALGEYVWPGYLRQGENNADLEVMWAMDDRDNRKHPYYPFKDDFMRRGIGLQIDGRVFQWSNVAAENVLFLVYTVTNVSDYDIDTVIFGIYGDPDLGGGSPYNNTDIGAFIPPFNVEGHPSVDLIPIEARSMVYFWDVTGRGPNNVPLGYLGCKFLESPGNDYDGIDNDGDGMIDESQENGIDDDGDWDPETDDVGIDGIPATGDYGEGDGLPTRGIKLPSGAIDPLYPGEPNFEYTDLDEVDQIGLTSFNSWTWAQDVVSNHESMWNRCIPGNFGQIAPQTDMVFIFGSGYIMPLKRGEVKRISMAFICGESLTDLITTAKTVQQIYNENYNFYKPPDLPTLTAVPGDRKVILYWDSKAEESNDKITGKDFEGYVIYRSTDPTFTDIQTITDGQGAKYLCKPLLMPSGAECKWDLENKWSGYHPVPYGGRGVHYYLGDNTGLVHSYVDSNDLINGLTYYYALVAYDHGDSVNIPPSETSKRITVDPITSEVFLDKNTAAVIPGPRVGGYETPKFIENQNLIKKGYSTGKVEFKILNDLEIFDNEYELSFSTAVKKNYSVLDKNVYKVTVPLFEEKFSKLEKVNISDDANFKVTSVDGYEYERDVDYNVDFEKGSLKRTENSNIPSGTNVNVDFSYYPIYQSEYLKGEDYNPVFDGILVKVIDEEKVEPDLSNSKWISGNCNYELFSFALTTVGARKYMAPSDYEIHFSDIVIDTIYRAVSGNLVKIPVKFTAYDVTTGVPIPVKVLLNKKMPPVSLNEWVPGDELIFFKTGAEGKLTDTLTWGVVLRPPSNGVDTIHPTEGDVFFLKVKKPFSANDGYTIISKAGTVNNQLAASNLDNIYVVPNPYIGYSQLEPPNRIGDQNRGERRIYFENLPAKCKIKIFTLSGELVKEINRDANVTSGREYWNLLNKDGFSVAYGLYLAHIDAPGIGEKVIKFALIK